MGVVAKAIGIHPTSLTPKADSGAEKTPTVMEVGWCVRGLLGGVGGGKLENMRHERLKGRKRTEMMINKVLV